MKAARFHRIRNKVLAKGDTLFAEPVELKFLKNGMPDAQRENIEIEAPLRTGGGQNTSVDGGDGQTWETRIVAGKAQLRVDRNKYPELKLTKGDKVRAIARDGQPWFEVLHVDDRSHERILVELGEA